MIAFSCTHCGMKFSVKDEFAGRSTHCPTCKRALVVPALAVTMSIVAPGSAVGPSSTLVTAGVHAVMTLGGDATAKEQVGSRSVADLLRQGAGGRRFLIEQELARGGMGSVHRAVDCDLRREIAVKYLLDQDDPGKSVRFVEEAQITGQLEHPNIVPIHELGIDAQKRLFFSMKMVRGRSLGQVFDDLRQNPLTAEKDHSLTRLLTVLLGVCNALSYAHSRRVIHRDLKPANIMLGDFGEVYVMDWGLAKVLTDSGTVPYAAPAPPASSATVALSASGSVASSKVSTSRDDGADLTREGSILGTPLYMPPEQAHGEIKEIDSRSDVYSLGAILYELLTLQPPVERSGGFAEILVRVIEGKIIRPEERTPERVRHGKLPPELSAVAMKALSKRKEHRYQSVEAFQRDIELYMEGRTVSAKQDTRWESFVKLVKRNKGASGGVATALLVLLGSLVFIGKAYVQLKQEQVEKQERTRQAVPALVQAGRLSVDRRAFDHAMTQVNLALLYDENNADARLLKGQLLLVSKNFVGAVKELDAFLTLRPDDKEGNALRELCVVPNPEEKGNLLKIAKALVHQKASALAEAMLNEFGTDISEARKYLLELYRGQIEAGWPGLGKRLTLDGSGLFELNVKIEDKIDTLSPLEGIPLTTITIATFVHSSRKVSDLSPLRGMPLISLSLENFIKLQDLSPLRGLPLKRLKLLGCNLSKDLTPLEGMNLTYIYIPLSSIREPDSMRVLREMKTLKFIEASAHERHTVENFWKKYDSGEKFK